MWIGVGRIWDRNRIWSESTIASNFPTYLLHNNPKVSYWGKFRDDTTRQIDKCLLFFVSFSHVLPSHLIPVRGRDKDGKQRSTSTLTRVSVGRKWKGEGKGRWMMITGWGMVWWWRLKWSEVMIIMRKENVTQCDMKDITWPFHPGSVILFPHSFITVNRHSPGNWGDIHGMEWMECVREKCKTFLEFFVQC